MNPVESLLAGLSGGPTPLQPTTQIATPGSPPQMNPMHRALYGFGAGMMTARPGLSPGQAFAQGLGGSLMGGFGYEQMLSQQQRQSQEDQRRREQDDFNRRMQVLLHRDRQENTGLRRRQIEDNREYRDRELDVRREGVRARTGGNRQAWADPQGTLLRIERDVDQEMRESAAGIRPGTPQYAQERARRVRDRRIAVFGTDSTEDIYRRSQTYGGNAPAPSGPGGGFVAPSTDEAVD